MISFDYYYGTQAEQFTFYRIPKVLFTDDKFKELSSDAKILYGLMLDRMTLSMKNGWLDEKNRVYIIFTLEQVMKYMNCGKDKGVKIFAELDSDKGIGLIERVKQGQGKPTLIYVKSFIITDNVVDIQTSEKPKSQNDAKNENENVAAESAAIRNTLESEILNIDSDFGKTEVLKSDLPKSAIRENRSPEVGKTDTINTNNNYTKNNKNNSNQSYQPKFKSKNIAVDGLNDFNINTEKVKENIEYELLLQEKPFKRDSLEEIADLITEVLCVKSAYIKLGKSEYPTTLVRDRFTKLNSSHIRYIIECMENNPVKINNIKSYILTALFNAPVTISQYYEAEVKHDLYG